jgi:hypothetical protein
MNERWQAFQLGWELFQHLSTTGESFIFNPLLGSIGARLKMLGLVLDFSQLDILKKCPPIEIVQRIPELKSYLGNQLLATAGTQPLVAFYLGFDLGLLIVVHANLTQGVAEPVEKVHHDLLEELDAVDIDPELLRPTLDKLGDVSITPADFAQLISQAAGDLARLLGNPRGREKVFVVMPFDPSCADTYQVIKISARYAGYLAWRADDKPYEGASIEDVYFKGIQEAAIVVIDLTNSRPNVYYEAGIAIKENKPLLFIAARDTKVQFDLRGREVLYFENHEDLRKKLGSELQKHAAAQPDGS